MPSREITDATEFTFDFWDKLPSNVKQNLMYAAGLESDEIMAAIETDQFSQYAGLLHDEYKYMFPEYSTRQEDYIKEIGETEREQATSAQDLWKEQQAEMKELKWGDYDPETGEGGIFTGQEYRAQKMIETLGAMDLDIEETQRDMLNRALKQDQFKLNQTLGKTGIQSGSQSDFRNQTILNAEAKIRQANITRKGMVDQMNMDLANLTADYDDKVAMDEATYTSQYNLKENALANFMQVSHMKEDRLIDAERESYEMGLWSAIGAISESAPTFIEDADWVKPWEDDTAIAAKVDEMFGEGTAEYSYGSGVGGYQTTNLTDEQMWQWAQNELQTEYMGDLGGYYNEDGEWIPAEYEEYEEGV